MFTKLKTFLRRCSQVALAIALIATSLVATAQPALAETHTVKAGSDNSRLIFVPEQVTIAPGDTVKWVMNSVPPHNVVFEGDKFPNPDKSLADKLSHDKLLFAAGSSYSSTFSEDLEPGRYPYYCEPHRGAGMRGDVIIEE